MEYIKGQDFSDVPNWYYWVNSQGKGHTGQAPSWYQPLDDKHPPLPEEVYGDYKVQCYAEDITIDVHDDGTNVINVRKITVEVSNSEVHDTVVTLEGHKIER